MHISNRRECGNVLWAVLAIPGNLADSPTAVRAVWPAIPPFITFLRLSAGLALGSSGGGFYAHTINITGSYRQSRMSTRYCPVCNLVPGARDDSTAISANCVSEERRPFLFRVPSESRRSRACHHHDPGAC